MKATKKFARQRIESLVNVVLHAWNASLADPLIIELNRIAISESAQYVSRHLRNSIIFPDKKDLYEFSFTLRHNPGSYLELGVYKGESINYFAKVAAQKLDSDIKVHGFDSFLGLAENWTGSVGFVRGHFSLMGQLPLVERNVYLHTGLFSDTLPKFKEENQEPLAFLHVDCDTYESTSQALRILGSQINPGTIIIFDEYIGFPGWQFGEFLAWKELVETRGLDYEYLAFSNQTALIRVL